MENLPESITSLSKSHEPHLVCVSLFLTFVHLISLKKLKKYWDMVSQKSGGVTFVSFKSPFSMDLLQAAPAFVHYSELGGSHFQWY